ncbi:hypothetical protein [Kineococcus sp. SYSU DK006]|uniref:hypothetical protein n=1 Tax=Kineococcus sp. SYSU DK006 TaxID=3383127 RepID=UPI003D7E2C79
MLTAEDTSTAGPDRYPVSAVTLEHARTALARVHPATAQRVWADLLTAAGLSGRESDRAALERLLEAMSASEDAVTVVCARALRIRLTTFDRLVAARAVRAALSRTEELTR